jgi:DNA helicase-2/ATP-dependent DNA helicase PcrA
VPRLDPQQNAAIAAGDGVVQVIAPAGSGKTTVLIERVRELVRRSTPPERILCTTFNRDACAEMAARLQAAGIFGVTVRSFHGLGLDILREEGQLRRELGPVDGAVWEQLARRAGQAAGCSGFSATRALEAVGHFKLAQMITPEVACRRAVGLPAGRRAEALVYAFYEDFLQRSGRLDFDDLIGRSIALLQRSGAIRHRWQDRFHRVLVDEYQDIEPAQALLVGLLAAPHDSLFCVGDEDQCIYAWRRASVQRVIDLDQTYPGLERYPLVRNYRCGRRITAASRRLIGHNRRRFRKPLLSGLREPGRISLVRRPDLDQGARFVAGRIRDAEPGTTAVLARTGRLLDAVAAAWGSPAAPGTESDPPPAGDPVRHLGGVELATVHGAKGREWDRVILFGADQGSFPLARAVKDPTAPGGGGLEDERRLFYVALTRARLRLEIVSCTARPSQFLREAGLR